MFDRFTYRQRNYGLLIMFVLLAMVSYKRSFLLTLNLKDVVRKQEIQKLDVKNTKKTIELLRFEIAQINKNLGKTGERSDRVQQALLQEISSFPKSYGLTIESINTTHLFTSVDYKILTNEVLIEGNFRGILNAIYKLEKEFDYARIINTDIYKTKARGDKKSKLYAKLLFQHYFKM